jgi:hypothetical protein
VAKSDLKSDLDASSFADVSRPAFAGRKGPQIEATFENPDSVASNTDRQFGGALVTSVSVETFLETLALETAFLVATSVATCRLETSASRPPSRFGKGWV